MSEDKAWIQTYSNKRFNILNPQPKEICIEDVAHALSMQCRFTGHTRFHYSVAQHSYYASLIAATAFRFEALMHDASEAYICDMNRPMKQYTKAGAAYREVEKVIEEAIARKFLLPDTMSAEVKRVDNMLLYAEKAQLMAPMEWDTRWAASTEAADIVIEKWTPEQAESNFLQRFAELACTDRLVR